jgi:Domain of unknown function (DUF5076)
VNALNPPPSTRSAKQAEELVRAWIVDGDLECSLNVGVFGEDETITWGILRSDIARHVANALEQVQGKSREQVLREIAASFNYEMKTPTADASGDLSDKQ